MSEEKSQVGLDRSWRYAICGFLLGIFAPIGWAALRLVFFWQPQLTLWQQVRGDIFGSMEHLALYGYMGAGTACVLGAFGYFLGRASQQIHDRAIRLDQLNHAVAQQNEEYERRFRELNNGNKNFHVINNQIQHSFEVQDVLNLAADGLHDILGYDRVNILMVDRERACLTFVASRGCGDDDVSELTVPLDERAGGLYKTVNENRLFLVEDVRTMPAEFALRPPCDKIPQLRSRSFILCPIVVRDEVVGLFGVDSKLNRKGLDDTDVDTVKLFADQVSSALTKLDLLQGVETLTRELEATFEELLDYREGHARHDRSLKEATDSTSAATSHIVDAADVISDAVDITRSASAEISVSIEQVSQNLQQFTTFMENSIASMVEISATIKEVEQSAGRSRDMSETVKSQAESGAEAVSKVLLGLDGISGSVESASASIGNLEQKGEEIGNITSVITEITQKTNLLALNAAIIAAQAGENGKSFAVVADEVRSLSIEAGNSTGEIARIIAEIQESTRETARHFDHTRQLVRQGGELGDVMEQSLNQILGSSVTAMDMAREILRATQEVSQSVGGVSEAIEELGDRVNQISTATREEAKGIQSIVKSIEEVKSMADDMVAATGRQKSNTENIESAVASVSEMVARIFAAMEERQQGSREVIEGLECLKRVGQTPEG